MQNAKDAESRIAAFDSGYRGLNAVRHLGRIASTRPSTSGLEGMPVLVKDCIDVQGMPTTAGSAALEGSMPRSHSDVAVALLDAGATIIGKTNQLELSGWVTFAAPPGYSALGGRALNPHDPRLSPGGSSSGSAVAVAAGYVPLAIGTDTGGSILNPAGLNGVYGLRPSTGLVSSRGIVPVTPRQDTAGPLAGTVDMLARGLSALARRSGDAAYEQRIRPGRLGGLRIGVPVLPDVSKGQARAWRSRLSMLRMLGASLVPVLADAPWRGHGDLIVPAYDFREHIGAHLAGLESPLGTDGFDALLAHYQADPEHRMPYGGANLLRSAAIDLERDRERRDEAWRLEQSSSRSLLDRAREEDDVAAVLFPAGGAAYLSSKAGYPAITIPDAFRPDGEAHYSTLLATEPLAEQLLIDIAHDIESVSGPPSLAPLT